MTPHPQPRGRVVGESTYIIRTYREQDDRYPATSLCFWAEPRFLKVNMTITTFWASMFIITAPLIALAYHVTHKSLDASLVQLIGLAVAGLLTVRYAKYARAKGAALAAGNAAA